MNVCGKQNKKGKKVHFAPHQLPSHMNVLSERILDFNGLLEAAQGFTETAAQARLPPLNWGQIDSGHI